MTYRMDLRGPIYDAHFGREHEEIAPERWIVERVLEGGEAYTVASFTEHGPAVALMALLAASLEVERGAKVEFECFTINQVVA